jgi:hypothetical protein
MEDGTEVEAFKGKVLKVFPQKSGTSDRGRDWTKQEILCKEGDRDLKIVLWGHEEQRNLVGRMLYIEAGQEAIIAEDNVWKGRTTRQLKVPESANLMRQEPSGERAETSSEESEQPERSEQRPSNPKNNGVKTYTEAHAFTGRCANALILSMRAAQHVGKTLEKESKLFCTPELFEAMATNIFRAMLVRGFIESMPVKAIAPPKELKAPEAKSTEAYQPGDDSESEPPKPVEPPPKAESKPTPPDDDVPF